MCAEDHVPGALERVGEYRVGIAGGFELLDFFRDARGGGRAEVALKLLERGLAAVGFRRGKGGVEGDDARAARAQLVDQRGVSCARERKRADFLQRPLVDADDDDAIIVRAGAAHAEAHVQRALFDALEERNARARVRAETEVGEKDRRPRS